MKDAKIATYLDALSPYFQLTALLCQHEISNMALQTIHHLLIDHGHPERIKNYINRHRTWTPIYYNCKKYDIDIPILLPWLKQKNTVVILNNMQIVVHQKRLVDSLNEKGICFTLLKGVNLSQRLYQNITYRHCRDIDILVSIADLEIAAEILNLHGFHCIDDLYRAVIPKNFIYRYYHHLEYQNKQGVIVELHWRLNSNRFDLPLNKIRMHHGAHFERILDDHDLLIYLAHHGARHEWHRLKWLLDIDSLLGHHSVWNFDELMERAQQLQKNYLLMSTFLLLSHVFCTPFPENIQHMMAKNKHGRRHAQKIIKHIFNEEQLVRLTDKLTMKARLKLFVGMIEQKLLLSQNWRASIEHLAIHLRPGINDFNCYTLPKSLFWLYYIFRPVRFILNKK